MLNYPEMRAELIACLRGLSDLDYQRKCWVLGECTPGVEDNFDLAVHFLFDDTELSANPEELIGYILKSSVEARAIRNLCRTIDDIFDEYGTDLTDEDYINLREWRDVVDYAKEALSLLEIKH